MVPNRDEIFQWAIEQGIELDEDFGKSPGNPTLRRLLRAEINRMLSKRPGSRSEERVCEVGLVSEFTIDNGLLTQTLKQRRDKVLERDRDVVSSFYGKVSE